MTFWVTIVYALFIALIFSVIFGAFRNHGPWGNFWVFLLILFLGMWAVGLWFTPVGPVWYGVAWLDLLLVGFVLALLLGAAGEKSDRSYIRDQEGEVDLVAESKREPGALRIAGIFFWLFLVAIIISIIIGIIRRGIMI